MCHQRHEFAKKKSARPQLTKEKGVFNDWNFYTTPPFWNSRRKLYLYPQCYPFLLQKCRWYSSELAANLSEKENSEIKPGNIMFLVIDPSSVCIVSAVGSRHLVTVQKLAENFAKRRWCLLRNTLALGLAYQCHCIYSHCKTKMPITNHSRNTLSTFYCLIVFEKLYKFEIPQIVVNNVILVNLQNYK